SIGRLFRCASPPCPCFKFTKTVVHFYSPVALCPVALSAERASLTSFRLIIRYLRFIAVAPSGRHRNPPAHYRTGSEQGTDRSSSSFSAPYGNNCILHRLLFPCFQALCSSPRYHSPHRQPPHCSVYRKLAPT